MSNVISFYTPHYLQFIVKITKLCNLRCHYCYEYPYLADKAKMTLEQIGTMFKNIKVYAAMHNNIKELKFIWHGGEPFIIPLDYYYAIKSLQTEIFGDTGLTIINGVQTNLTILPQRYIDALKNELFDTIGVSFDPFDDTRVNKNMASVHDKILNNMQTLVDNDIGFGCICVLSRKTHPNTARIFDFFDENYIGYRLLPIFKTLYNPKPDDYSLTPEEILDAFKLTFEKWLQSDNAVRVIPIDDYIDIALDIMKKETRKIHYNRALSNYVFIVNTNGAIYSTDDIYRDEACYGNIFEQSFTDIMQSVNYMNSLKESSAKMKATCHQCEYYGHCLGYEMAESTYEQIYFNDKGELTCTLAKPMITYIIKRLTELNYPLEVIEEGNLTQLAV